MPDLSKFNYSLENKNILKEKAKAGRKKLNLSLKKNNYIRIALDDKDFLAINEYCQKKGVQPAVFCRSLIKDFLNNN